jgi:hypothetical protein
LPLQKTWRKNISREEIHYSIKNSFIVIAEYIIERLDPSDLPLELNVSPHRSIFSTDG